MINNKKYLKNKKKFLKAEECKYKINFLLKIILVFFFPLWIFPFLISNFFIGLIMRNIIENFQKSGQSKNKNFDKIHLNTLDFYNRDMELQKCLQLTISNEEWNIMQPKEIKIKTYDNLTLLAFFIENKQTNKNNKWVIATHGWQQNRYSILYLVKYFYEQGYNIITYNTRGHFNNKNEKVSITFGNKEANDLYYVILNLKDYLLKNNNQQKLNITLIGNSMGGNIILETISRFDISKLGIKCGIVDCGFDNFSNIIKIMGKKYFNVHWFWFFYGVKFFFKIKDKFDINSINTIKKLKNCSSIPILFIHGDADEIVPLNMTKKMYEKKISYEKPKISELLIIKFAKHIRSITTNYDEYCKITLKFVNKWTNEENKV